MGLFVAPALAWGSQVPSQRWGKGDFGGISNNEGKRGFKSQGNVKPSCFATKNDGGEKQGHLLPEEDARGAPAFLCCLSLLPFSGCCPN